MSPSLLSLLSLADAVAQTPIGPEPAPVAVPAGGQALSLEEALKRSIDASESVSVARSQAEQAEGSRWTARAGYLPSINGAILYTRQFRSEFAPTSSTTTTTPTTPTPTAPTGTGTGTGTGTQGAGGGASFVLPFAQPNQWRAQIQIDQGIWGGGTVSAQNRIANASARSADVGVESALASAALDTATAYYDAILAQRLPDIAGRSLDQAKESLRQAELRQSVGRDPEFELLRAKVAVDNQEVSLIQAQRSRDVAFQRLALLLEIDPETPLVLTTELDETDIAPLARSVSGAASAEVPRAPVRQLVEAETVALGSRQLVLAAALPSLSASATLGYFQGTADFVPGFEDKAWLPYQSVGLTLSVPIFNGAVWGSYQSAKAAVDTAQSQLAQTTELVDIDTAQTMATLDAAVAQWAATEGAVGQARRAYEIAELRFQEGLATQLELNDSRLQLERAEANRAQAARDLGVSRIRVALLPSLPVALPGAGR